MVDPSLPGRGPEVADKLSYEVRVSAPVQEHGSAQVRGGYPRLSSPVSATLISGTSDAFLVDPPFTIDQTTEIGDWIAGSGKNLVGVYITHGHGDHWFGAGLLQDRFPEAVVYATQGTIALMRRQAAPAFKGPFWEDRFPGQIPVAGVIPVVVPEGGLLLEGQALLAVQVGHSDADDSTVLHVPSIGLVVAGDVVYNGVHQYMVESGNGGSQAWLTALDTVEALQPSAVVAGHKNLRLSDDPTAIARTRAYLRDSNRLLREAPTREGYFDQMMTLNPDLLNPKVLWRSASALILGSIPSQEDQRS